MVAGGHHNHNACLPCLLDGLAERIERGALIDAAPQQEIPNRNVVLGFELDCLQHSLNDDAVSALSILIQHTQIDEVDARSQAPELAIV